MRQLSYLGPGSLDWQDVPDPRVRAVDEVIVKPLAVARCDLDVTMARDGLFPGPYPIGHEFVGEVVDVGSTVTSVRPGDTVLVPFQPSCGRCEMCRNGRYVACTTCTAPAGSAFGFGAAGGGHGGAVADLIRVPHAEHLLLPICSDLPLTTLCTLSDNVADGYRAVGPDLARTPGADVLILGGFAASVGLYAVAFATALGASTVRYVDHDTGRCRVATQLGADAAMPTDPWPRRFDRAAIVVDNTGSQSGLSAAIRSTQDLGTCTSVAIYFQNELTLPLLEMYTRGCTYRTGRTDSKAYLPEVLRLVTAHAEHFTAIAPTIVNWSDARDHWLQPATKLILTR